MSKNIYEAIKELFALSSSISIFELQDLPNDLMVSRSKSSPANAYTICVHNDGSRFSMANDPRNGRYTAQADK